MLIANWRGTCACAAALLAAACGKKLDGPQPAIDGVSPAVACNDGLATEVTLSGAGLSPLNDRLLTSRDLELPAVQLTLQADLSGAAVAAEPVTVPDDPANPEASDVRWASQQSMSFRICPPGTCSTQSPAGTDYALSPGLYTVSVTNRNGRGTAFSNALTVVPAPVLTSIDSDLLCLDQDNTLELTGENFLRIDGQPAAVGIGTQSFVPSELLDCRSLPSFSTIKLEACGRARVRVPANTFTSGTYPVSVTGPAPAGCRSQQPVSVTFVPEPSLTRIVPDLACLAGAGRTFTLEGTGFLTVGGQLPRVAVGSASFAPTAAGGCLPVTGPAAAVQTCTSLTLDLPQDGLPAAIHPVTVTNPAPADCTSSPPVNLVIVAPPVITSVQPDLACNEQGVSVFTLTGTGFLGIESAAPTVRLAEPNGVTYATVAGDVSLPAASCAVLSGPTEAVLTCTQLEVRVPQGALTASGAYAFTVTNPAPAGCSSTQAASVMVVPAPRLTGVQPALVCSAQGAVTLTATGSGFLTVAGTPPSVTFAGPANPLTITTGIVASGCTAVAGSALAVQSCTALSIPTPANAFSPGASYRVTVTNPAPAGCATAESVTIGGTSAPTVAQVSPATLCTGGGLLTLTGAGFEPGAQVRVGAQVSSSIAVADGGLSAVATFGTGTAGGPFAVTVVNASGCSATAAQQVSVVPGPLMVFVEPRVAWSGMNTPLTVYAANVSTPVTSVQLAPSAAPAVAPTNLVFAPAAGHPDRPIAILPRATDAGVYDVLFSDQAGCPARLSPAVTVTANTALTLTGVSPRFGWTGSPTDLTVRAAVSDGGAQPSPGFGPLPLVYLTPSATQSTITRLGSVAVVSPVALTTEVPAGLDAGSYDLVVVNQDGTVGVRPMAFRVNVLPPPAVSSVTPANVSTGIVSQPITIQGANFRVPGLGPRPAVTFRCLSPTGVAMPDQALAVSAATSTSISATVNTTQYPAGANCIVEVINGDDQSTAEFASVVVVNSSANLTGFTAGPDLGVARRGLGAAAGGFSQSARFVYALGGDDGSMAHSTVEVLPVDIFGTAGPAFFTQRYALSSPRTQTSAVRIGRFLYAAGGTTTVGSAANALDTVERAAILDPSTAPVNLSIDLDVVPAASGGLSDGTFYYRVAAVMSGTDPFNPGGEALPSDAFGLTLPPLSGFRVQVELSWDPVPGAAGYRIYRTAANGAAGSETLIADVAPPPGVTCSGPTVCTDRGAGQLSPQGPLLPGSTGRWTVLPQRLATPRVGPGVTWATDPASPNQAYLYVFGGLSDGGVALTSYEYLPLSIDSDGGAQTPSPFVSGGAGLTGARWRLRGFTTTPRDSTFVGTDSFVWAGPGSAAAPSTIVTNIDGARVLSGGALGPFTTTVVPGHAGYGAFAAGDFLYLLGGQNGLANVETVTAELVAAPPPPGFGNIQSFTPGLRVPRVDLGATLQSGYFYSLGGATPDGGVTRSTEFVLY